MAEHASNISDQLLTARKNAAALSEFPGNPPATLEDAYQIQHASLSQWPDVVAGWKVGGIPEDLRAKLGADWLVGPIFERSVKRTEGDASVAMPIYAGGFAAIEPELVVQLGNTRDEDRIFIGAEIASSPVPDINGYGPTAVVSDFGNNNGLLIGPEIADWRNFQEPLEVSIWIDGEAIGSKTLQPLTVTAAKALQFCIDIAAEQNRELPAGTFVSTGAITGIHEAAVGAKAKIAFGNLGALHLHLTQAEEFD